MSAVKNVLLFSLMLVLKTNSLSLDRPQLYDQDVNHHERKPSDAKAPSINKESYKEILKNNIYLAHLANGPEVKEMKIEDRIKFTTRKETKARVVNTDDDEIKHKTKDETMDIIIFPDSDMIIPPKGRSSNRSKENNVTGIANVTIEEENISAESQPAKTNVNGNDHINIKSASYPVQNSEPQIFRSSDYQQTVNNDQRTNGNVNFPNEGLGNFPIHGSNSYQPQSNLNTVLQNYQIPNQVHQPANPTRPQNIPSSPQLLILPPGYQSVPVTQSYQVLALPTQQNTASSGQVVLLSPAQGNYILLAPGQNFLVLPSNSVNFRDVVT